MLKKRQVQVGFNSIVALEFELTDYHWHKKCVSSIKAQVFLQRFSFLNLPRESILGSGEYKKAEYMGRRSERQLKMLKVSIFVKPNMVISNRFWVELSNENNKFKNNPANFYLIKVNSRKLEKAVKYGQS